MLYLSPVWHSLLPQYRERFGYILQPDNYVGNIGMVISGQPWLADNGCFAETWTEAKWLAMLERYCIAGNCIAAVCPDVVGDAAGTIARFAQYAPVIRHYGYPVAFVTQDGLRMDAVPWEQFEVLFVGGVVILTKCERRTRSFGKLSGAASGCMWGA